MSDKHTPLPKLTVDDESYSCWFSHKNHVSENYHYITGDDGGTSIHIAAIMSKEHAEHFAKASNNYKALVGALKTFLNAINSTDPDSHEHIDYAEQKAKQLLEQIGE